MITDGLTIERQADEIRFARGRADASIKIKRQGLRHDETIVVLEDNVYRIHAAQGMVLVESHFVTGAAFGNRHEIEHFCLFRLGIDNDERGTAAWGYSGNLMAN
jgi:hypothetical protein